ncbi:molybdopterin-dependent oxidoreductase [Dyella sp. C9]|uniref:molybdopterin-dependent oxidoreductase n=1 Tax=Dyella sp. C9 TaxID=2202154 RepID=UPI001300255B|nr:molybdopterin-dependent oxidoreductase [Dyella sp. C9]
MPRKIATRLHARATWLLLGCCLAWGVIAADAAAPAAVGAVEVVVAGKPGLTLGREALSGLPRTTITAAAHEEAASQWQGVALDEILRRAGAPLDKPLRGRNLASYVRVTASDHYQVVFGLAELDPTLGHARVILADQRDGKPLGDDGPFRLVVEGDQRPARWVRNVTRIEVIDGSTNAP